MRGLNCLWISFLSIVLYGQTTTKITLESKDIELNDIAGISQFINLGTVAGSKVCAINCINKLSNQNEMMLFPFYDQTDIASALFIYHREGNLYINKIIHTGYDDVFFLGTYNKSGSGNFMVLGVFSLKLKAIKTIKIISLSTDPDFILNPIDVIYSNGNFYIVAESLIEYLSSYNSKIVLIKFDGNDISWSKIYNSVAPIHSEAPRSIVMAPNGNLCIAGTIKRSFDSAPRMMLAQFDTDGNPVTMKSVELMSPDLSFSNRYGWTYVNTKGANIHLFSQSIVGSSEPGSVLVTMFDTDLQLKTWRNYTVPIRVESAVIDGNFFLFGGQAPVDLGYEGYNLMKVNSLNAIVEQFKNYKPGLKNDHIASSSASVYDRATDHIWSVIRPNGATENYIVLLENTGVLENPCATDLVSSVAKDPMQLNEVPVNVKSIQLQLADLDVYVREINMSTSEICRVTQTEDWNQSQIQLFPNPTQFGFVIASNEEFDEIEIFNSLGNKLFDAEIHQKFYSFHKQLPGGIYFVHISSKERPTIVKKLTID
jgi:hypothetical protein